jgi:hypothetical protein
MDAKQRKAMTEAAHLCLKLLQNEGHYTLTGARLINPFMSMFVRGVAYQAAQDKALLEGVVRQRDYGNAEMERRSSRAQLDAFDEWDPNASADLERHDKE